MHNVTTKIEGKTLVIRIDLANPGKPSATGKTTLIATTGAGIEVKPGVRLALNLMQKGAPAA
jgi:hypothetical protein